MPGSPNSSPSVVIFANPNGAGKSTHANAILAALGIDTFVNADYIARGLSGRHADAVAFEAGRILSDQSATQLVGVFPESTRSTGD